MDKSQMSSLNTGMYFREIVSVANPISILSIQVLRIFFILTPPLLSSSGSLGIYKPVLQVYWQYEGGRPIYNQVI